MLRMRQPAMQVADAAVDFDGAAAGGFEDQAAEGDVGDVGELEQGSASRERRISGAS